MAFADIDKQARIDKKREEYRKKEAEQKGKVEAIPAQKVEVLPPTKDGGGFNVNLPAPIQGMTISPKIEINMPDPEPHDDSRWRAVGREVVETAKSMMLGAAAYALILALLERVG